MDNSPKITLDVAMKIIPEIIRLHNKMLDGGYSNIQLTEETTSKVVNGKLEYSYKLKAGDVVIAFITQTDNRSLEEIKAAKEADKIRLQQEADAEKAKIDEVIAVVDAKTKL